MGLGKTLTTIAFLLSLGDALCRVLVVVPKSLLFHWEGEIARWDSDRVLCVTRANDGAQFEALLAAWAVTPRAVLLCGYETLSLHLRDHRSLLVVPYLAVFDEAHRLRNSQALRTLSAQALGAERRLMLTGTPMQNHIAEYFSMLEVAHPGWWPREKFKFMFEIPIVQGQARDASEYARGAMNSAVVSLQRALAGVVHRRGPELLTAVLPPLQVRTAILQISRAEAVAYNAGVAATREAGMFSVRHRVSVVDANSVKVRVAMDIIETAQSFGEKVIVFSQWLAPLHLLHNLLFDATITSSILSGDTSALDRERLKDRFNNVSDASLSVLLVATRAGGEGLNLIGATRVIVFDVSWNPANDAQAWARAYRYGQTSAVFVYQLVCYKTIEYHIYKQTLAKLWRFKRIVDDTMPTRAFQAHTAKVAEECLQYLNVDDVRRPDASVGRLTDPVLRHTIERYPAAVLSIASQDDVLADNLQERYVAPKLTIGKRLRQEMEPVASIDPEWEARKEALAVRLGGNADLVRQWQDRGVAHFFTLLAQNKSGGGGAKAALVDFHKMPCVVWGRLDAAAKGRVKAELDFEAPLPTQLLVDGAHAWLCEQTPAALAELGGADQFIGSVFGEFAEEDDQDPHVEMPDWVTPKSGRQTSAAEVAGLLGVEFSTDGTMWRCPGCKRGQTSQFMTPCRICRWDAHAAWDAHPLVLLRTCVDHICELFDRLSWIDPTIDAAVSTARVCTAAAEVFIASLQTGDDAASQLLRSLMAQCRARTESTFLDMCQRDFSWVLKSINVESLANVRSHVGGTSQVVVALFSRGLEAWWLGAPDTLLEIARGVLHVEGGDRDALIRSIVANTLVYSPGQN